MITLKHLCREFNLDPYPLRQKLRKALKHKRNQRWQWSEDDPQLAEARKIAKALSMQTEGEK
ncbi:MAG: hypothetical protein D6698_01740 [Gammaproteobacteria bacterium]|nr:MAG: hypothetical protein D6698_01740 [Gammaproteobacteria bacterium]